MLEQKLQEELNRYKSINKYGKTMIMEQDAPPPADLAAPPAPDAAPAPGGDIPPPPADAPADAPAPDAAAPDAAPAADMNSTEEIDITDLVDMVKSVKKGQEDSQNNNSDVVSKMDDVFTKLTDLESKLGEMNQIISKIDELGQKVQEMKPKSAEEKLEMRSLDSYPFSQNPQQFFDSKIPEMQASGKNEYILTKNDVQDYTNNMIKDTFNPQNDTEDEYKY
jgi:hypothetical protein